MEVSLRSKENPLAGRSRSTFGKRQKEQKRQEKRQDKAARRDQRKTEKRVDAHGNEVDDSLTGETFADLMVAHEDDTDD